MCHSTNVISVVLLVTSDAPADQRSRNQAAIILLTLHHTIHPHIAASSQPVSRIRRPWPERSTLLCPTGRCIFPISAAQHPNSPSIMLGLLSLVGSCAIGGCFHRQRGRSPARRRLGIPKMYWEKARVASNFFVDALGSLCEQAWSSSAGMHPARSAGAQLCATPGCARAIACALNHATLQLSRCDRAAAACDSAADCR